MFYLISNPAFVMWPFFLIKITKVIVSGQDFSMEIYFAITLRE